uniref:Uncharacterized protein n=1 Tax=Anguilla anguilla TaxID=7936 RepID=A0A0E9W675_ANGAN
MEKETERDTGVDLTWDNFEEELPGIIRTGRQLVRLARPQVDVALQTGGKQQI